MFVRFILKRREEKGRQAIVSHSSVYDILAELRWETAAARVAVVKCHNGGAVPTARTPLYSTALYEVSEAAHGPIREKWQGLPIDKAYTDLLSTVVEDGSVRVHVGEVNPGSTLAAIYGTAGVQTVVKHYITHDASGLYYLSVQWTDSDHSITPPQALAIQAAIPRLKRCLES